MSEQYTKDRLPTCPHCKNSEIDWTELFRHAYEQVITCSECGKKYKSMIAHTVVFYNMKED